jgi:NAD(P)-dependent dehydrogenase (short-subunit alcohol dehydrogenase family)
LQHQGYSAEVDAMFDRVWATGPLDALINKAAANFIAQTDRLSYRAIDAVLATTLYGGLYCTVAAGRRWIDAGRPGCVLSILSTSVRTGRPFTVPSVVAKTRLEAMTRSLAVEWGPLAAYNCPESIRRGSGRASAVIA